MLPSQDLVTWGYIVSSPAKWPGSRSFWVVTPGLVSLGKGSGANGRSKQRAELR